MTLRSWLQAPLSPFLFPSYIFMFGLANHQDSFQMWLPESVLWSGTPGICLAYVIERFQPLLAELIRNLFLWQLLLLLSGEKNEFWGCNLRRSLWVRESCSRFSWGVLVPSRGKGLWPAQSPGKPFPAPNPGSRAVTCGATASSMPSPYCMWFILHCGLFSPVPGTRWVFNSFLLTGEMGRASLSTEGREWGCGAFGITLLQLVILLRQVSCLRFYKIRELD